MNVWGAGEVRPLLASWVRAAGQGGEEVEGEGCSGAKGRGACALLVAVCARLRLGPATLAAGLQLARAARVARAARDPLPLLLASACLAGRAAGHGGRAGLRAARRAARHLERRYTRRQLREQERALFRTVGFQVPLHTVVDLVNLLIEMCAIPIGMDAEKLREVSEALLKFTYLLHDQIFSRYRWAIGKNVFLCRNYDYHQPLLAGSIVLSACRIANEKFISLVKNSLVEQTKVIIGEMDCLANIITTFALE